MGQGQGQESVAELFNNGQQTKIESSATRSSILTRSLSENRLPYRQLLLRCSNSGIHAVVRRQ